MEYSSLTDFDSKLNALKDPECPGDIIDKIVMDDDFPWGSEEAEVAKDLIAIHKNTSTEQLKNLFENAANKEQKHKILLNPSCPKSLFEMGVKENIYKLEELEDLSKNHKITSALAQELFVKGVRLQKNGENKNESTIGQKIQNNLLGNPSFVDVRKTVRSDGYDMFEFFITQVKHKYWVMPIAKNINCPNEILEIIVKDFEIDGEMGEVVKEAILNDNYQPKKEQFEQLILSDNKSNIKKGLLINETKFPENLIEFEISIQFDKKDMNENDGVESLFYDSSANDSLKIKSGGPIKSIFKDFRFLKWLQGIYIDTSHISVTTNFDSNPVPGDEYIKNYTDLAINCISYDIKNIKNDYFTSVKEAVEEYVSIDDDDELFNWLEMASKSIILLPDIGAPEKLLNVFSLADLIDFSDGLSDDSLEEWFKEYRYEDDEAVPQGDEYHNGSIIKQVLFPSGLKKSVEIEINGKTYDAEKSEKIKSMKDFDILIEGEVHWSKGLWKTFTCDFNDNTSFDKTKLSAVGKLGVITDYFYDGNTLEKSDDHELEDGYTSLDVSIYLNGDIHELNIEELRSELEKEGKDLKNIDDIKGHIANSFSQSKDNKEKISEDIYDLCPFNMDYEENDHIEACREGTLFIEKAKAGEDSFEVEFASFGDARCFYRYIWDEKKLTQIIVENGDLFTDDELDEGLDDSNWNEALEHEYFPDLVEKAIKEGECETKVLYKNSKIKLNEGDKKMAYVFSLKSKSGLSFEKEEGDGTVDMNDFFNTGEDDDTVCSYFVEFDEDAGVVTFDGEWGEEDDDSLEGSRPDIFDIEKRLNAFAEFFDVEWEDGSKIVDDSDDYEIKF